MSDNAIDNEQKRRIDHVVHYISDHLDDQVSLETLAGVAHYSPFHLQKVFKQIVGDSPKQYTIKLRLETAFHLLVIHPQKSVQEISVESGFSSPAVFSRAMKRYFGHSPEQIRHLPHSAKMKLLHDIQRAFKELTRIAGPRDWLKPRSRMYGILSPHQRNIYKAFLPVNQEAEGAEKFTFTEIKGGTFAVFTVSGDLKQVNKAAHHFYREWLPDSGYKITGITGFETFAENPADTPYCQLEREIYIPIGPSH